MADGATHSVPRPLDLLCRCMVAAQQGRELDAASAAALVDPATDLLGLARLAGRHCVTPLLAPCIAAPALRQRLPPDFTAYVEFVHAENSRRNRALRRQLRHVAGQLNEIGIEPVLLKGAIRLVDGLYRDPGSRVMRDLDLLVARERLSDAVARLASLGYRFTQDAAELPEQHRHVPPLARDCDAAVIEIHADLLSERREFCDAGEVLTHARSVDLDGTRVRVPTTAHQLAHLIGHDRFDTNLHLAGMFLLRSVFETALLGRDQQAVGQLLTAAATAGLARCARVRLGLAGRLFPEHVAKISGGDMLEGLQLRALLAMERCDQNGRWRELMWFGLRLNQVLMSSAERKRVASNLLSSDYRQRGITRLRGLWPGH